MGGFLKGTRDLIQIVILLIILIIAWRVFTFASPKSLADWWDYRRAISHIERKDENLTSKAEGFFLRFGGRKDKNKAIEFLCRLALKEKEEAELLLLIYDKGRKDCDKPKASTAPAVPALPTAPY